MTISRSLAATGALAMLAATSGSLPNVPAVAETRPVTTKLGDRADDPAIWRNPDDPQASLIVSTDKKAGLAVHDLTGRLLNFQRLGALNNVDIFPRVVIAGKPAVVVAASDRGDRKRPVLRLFRLDTSVPTFVPMGAIHLAGGEAYGLCLYSREDSLGAFMVYEEGVIEQVELDFTGTKPTGRSVRRYDLGSRSEGCVSDPRTGHLYVAEDKVAIWRFGTDPDSSMRPVKFAAVDGVRLHKDVEGLAILPRGRDAGLLFASSQGDDSFSVFRLPDGAFVGGFRIGGGTVDGAEDTDGIALDHRPFGRSFPEGIFVAQDGKNRDYDAGRTRHAPQNFKLVSLRDILTALGEQD
ncbi:phytase [Tsuneonella sp. SYSU-LHT278]|uniref:phytase n=1 Tax=Tsuneonella sediminis TaxID=3416089 RepID=UPI003F78E9D0